VPRTRAGVNRDDKVDEIVDAARQRLVDGGYDALSVADIARELGLAQNAVYWYFPTKDHLLVAAVERILGDVLARKPRSGTVVEHVVWFTERLHEFQDLRLTIHARARRVEVVATFARDVDALLRVMLVNGLRGAVAADRLEDTADAVMALCDGVLLRGGGRQDRARVVKFGVKRLLWENL
jgi:AcrR family transcriptional regulator